MRVMVMVKATKNSEAGVMPSAELMSDMQKFNEQLVAAGIMKSGDGLKPSKFGKRIRFTSEKRTLIDGPFAETKELVAGFWMWEVKSLQEAIDWVKKCPPPMPGEESEIEIRPLYEMEDFGDALTPEVLEKDAKMRETLAAQQKK
ncbi:dehydrogenase [Betaproteobacteria bacterium GR16-43]|nr:dehydrogenase [Betaproteobacteria bacterium GR16-43]